VIRSICHLNKKGYQVIEVKKRTEDAFTNEVKDRSEALPFTKVKESWYLSSRGRNTNNWVGSFREYKSRLENLNLSEDFVVDGEKVSEENSVEESLAKSIFLNTFKQQSFVACAIGLALFLSVKYPDH
jgi:hypothetical protein